MSNYASDEGLDLFGSVYRIDVAADVVHGKDVRILLDGRAAYLEPANALAMAAALSRCALLAAESFTGDRSDQ